MSASKRDITSFLTFAALAAAATPPSTVASTTVSTSSILSPSSQTVSSLSSGTTLTISLSSSAVTTIVVPVKSFQSSSSVATNSSTSATTNAGSSAPVAVASSLGPPSTQTTAAFTPVAASTTLAKPSPATSSGLTTSTRIGLGVSIGIGVPILLLLMAILFLLIRRSRNQQRDLTEIDQKLAEPTGGISRPETAGDPRGGSRTPMVAELEGTQVQVPVIVNKEEPSFSNDAHWKRILEERLEALQIGKRRLSEIEDDETEGMKNRFSGVTEDGAAFQRFSRYSDPETRMSRAFPGPSTPRSTSDGSPDRLQIPRFPSPYPNDPDLLRCSQITLSRGNSGAIRRQRSSGWSDDEPSSLQPQRQRLTGSSSAPEADGMSHVQSQRSNDQSDNGTASEPRARMDQRYTNLSEESEIRHLQQYTASVSADSDDPLRQQQHEEEQQSQQQQQADEERRQLERSARWSDAITDDGAQVQRSSDMTGLTGVTNQTRVQTLSSLDSDDLRTGSPVTQEDMNRWQHYG